MNYYRQISPWLQDQVEGMLRESKIIDEDDNDVGYAEYEIESDYDEWPVVAWIGNLIVIKVVER